MIRTDFFFEAAMIELSATYNYSYGETQGMNRGRIQALFEEASPQYSFQGSYFAACADSIDSQSIYNSG
jgi:hypothetical protein